MERLFLVVLRLLAVLTLVGGIGAGLSYPINAADYEPAQAMLLRVVLVVVGLVMGGLSAVLWEGLRRVAGAVFEIRDKVLES